MPIAHPVASNKRNRNHVKTRLLPLAHWLTGARFALTSRQGRDLRTHLDRVNGIKDDHRLAKLRMLYPNCHSQMPTYGIDRSRELQECRAGM
ncbi:MAG TPA: hypothetical protein VGF86_13775 [Candidatus Tumulicola sp.]